jgi:signal transduction histidine kinase
MARPGQARPAGFVVAGVSPRLVFDDGYKGFLALLAGQISASIANAQAYDEERRRAEALAELDRAKTAFFSNVSHEFRTPLTLMLGPDEDALAEDVEPLPPRQCDRVEIIHRNALRLLKLVNILLDFSRIEAGRVQAVYEPTDLAALTADLASVFRSAVERAGIELVVDCPPLPEPAYVDRDMWEKIVLNLVSNAFKFTLEGRIAVTLRAEGDLIKLRVEDSGTGIPTDELPRLFERFHRVEGTRGRTHEGTGIGLALVQELARLHGGRAEVESTFGDGSSFTVTIPRGREHLPAGRVGVRDPWRRRRWGRPRTWRRRYDGCPARGARCSRCRARRTTPASRASTRPGGPGRAGNGCASSWPTTTRTCASTSAACLPSGTTSRRSPTGCRPSPSSGGSRPT